MNDNIDQQVKFKSTSQEVYDHLAEKDPNSLYFAEDTQRIYKGDTKFSDGSVDEDRFVKVYELSESEFWDKLSSGDLQVGQYLYPTPGLVTHPLPSDIVYHNMSGVVDSGDMYYIMTYNLSEANFVAQISHDFTKIKSFDPARMIPDIYPHVSVGWNDRLNNNCIGCDDFGYLYMSANGTKLEGDDNFPYNYGVISVNTANIDDSSEWGVANTFDFSSDTSANQRTAFRPFNLVTSYNSSDDYNAVPTMYRDPLLVTKEGGLFGFVFYDNFDADGVRPSCRYGIPKPTAARVKYYKAGICKEIPLSDDTAPAGYWRFTLVGPRCFATNPDNDNKLYYLSCPYAKNGDNNIIVSSFDANGTYQCYNVVIDDSTKNGFTSIEARYASFIRCKNNKAFVFIGNKNPVCAVLDLATGEYTNVTKFANFTFDASKSYSTVSNIVEGDNSICFTIFNGEICQYVCWNYTEDRIYSIRKRIARPTNHRNEKNASCDILRQGRSNSIIAYSCDFDSKTVKIETLSCDNLSAINTWILDNPAPCDNGFAVAPMYELPDKTILILSYADSEDATQSGSLAAATIDESGNIKYCSKVNNMLDLTSDFNRSVVIPSSIKDNYLLNRIESDRIYSYSTLIDVKNSTSRLCFDLTHEHDSLRRLILGDDLLAVSYSRFSDPHSYTTTLGLGLTSYVQTDQKVRIINEGDITL